MVKLSAQISNGNSGFMSKGYRRFRMRRTIHVPIEFRQCIRELEYDYSPEYGLYGRLNYGSTSGATAAYGGLDRLVVKKSQSPHDSAVMSALAKAPNYRPLISLCPNR